VDDLRASLDELAETVKPLRLDLKPVRKRDANLERTMTGTGTPPHCFFFLLPFTHVICALVDLVKEKFPEYREVDPKTIAWLKDNELQCDIILISKDGQKLVIGEINNHLDHKTFCSAGVQLRGRESALNAIRSKNGGSDGDHPEELENVRWCHLVVGGEVIGWSPMS